MDNKITEILWTGGFDSTYRMTQLSFLPITIQPYYLSDNRSSEKMELDAINQITELINKKVKTKCNILPLRYFSINDRKDDMEITTSFNRLLENDFFGSQYDWLGRFSKEYKGIELSIHEDDKAILLIKKYGRLKTINDSVIGKYYTIDTDNSPNDINAVFQHFHFPIVDYTKIKMKKDFVEWGYEDIMNTTWFCHTPIKEKPCGVCNPCIYTIEEGMKERLPKFALIRYRKRKVIKKIKAIVKK